MKPKRTTFSSQAEFRRAVGVSKGTMSKYCQRDDWPVKREAPWGLSDLATVQRWRDELQEDRAAEYRGKSAVELEVELNEVKATVEHFTGLSYSAWVRSCVADLNKLADEFEAELKQAARKVG